MPELELAADLARRMTLGGVGGQALGLRGRGLAVIPTEVWLAAPVLAKLDLSDNPVSPGGFGGAERGGG